MLGFHRFNFSSRIPIKSRDTNSIAISLDTMRYDIAKTAVRNMGAVTRRSNIFRPFCLPYPARSAGGIGNQ